MSRICIDNADDVRRSARWNIETACRRMHCYPSRDCNSIWCQARRAMAGYNEAGADECFAGVGDS